MATDGALHLGVGLRTFFARPMGGVNTCNPSQPCLPGLKRQGKRLQDMPQSPLNVDDALFG